MSVVRLRIGEDLDRRPAPLFIVGCTVAVYAGVCVLQPGLPERLAFVDPVLLLLAAYSIVSMTYRGSPATSSVVRLAPWFWCILLGSFLGLSAVGIPFWAMANLARTVFALVTFVCLWHLIGTARLQRFAIVGLALGMFVTCASLLSQAGAYRSSAFFIHPNYAGHFVVMAGVVLFAVTRRWSVRMLIAVGVLIALQQTSSFGAMAMLIAMLAVYAARALRRNTAILAASLAALAIGGLFLATPQAADLVPDDGGDWVLSDSISEERLGRSSDTRFLIWSQAFEAYAEEPLGVGPDGVRRRELAEWRGRNLEIHSDSLGYLVERGVIGLIGFIGLWVTLIALAKKGGLARVLIAGILVQGTFRETMHYRHMWLMLALAFAIDYARSDEGSDDVAEDATLGADGDEPIESESARPRSSAYFPGVAPWPNVP